MSWIFNTHATPGTNPWSWEWGSPKSFAGHRPCGCRRCESCKCYKLDKSVPRSKQPPPKIAPPPQSAHTAAAALAQDWWDAVAQRARSPSPHWSDPEYERRQKRRAAGTDVPKHPDPLHWSNDRLALIPSWLQSTPQRDRDLSKYYEKYGTFNGAHVITTHQGSAAPTQNSEELWPAAPDKWDNYILNATVEENKRGVKRSLPECMRS
jgi:hypothetical protein